MIGLIRSPFPARLARCPRAHFRLGDGTNSLRRLRCVAEIRAAETSGRLEWDHKLRAPLNHWKRKAERAAEQLALVFVAVRRANLRAEYLCLGSRRRLLRKARVH